MICNVHPAECSKLHCQERYEDLERSRARCAALRADLAAARERAEQAESAAAVWEQRCSQATALSGQHLADLAAARRERDALRARLESAVAALKEVERVMVARMGDGETGYSRCWICGRERQSAEAGKPRHKETCPLHAALGAAGEE